MRDFYIVPGRAVKDILADSATLARETVRRAYLAHYECATVNPNSYFMRFPERPDDRMIALPARLSGDVDRIGIKWISSFPSNTINGMPRASAVLILNDTQTGYPVACLEAAGISAARTAASAAIANVALSPGDDFGRAGFVGAGVIARAIAGQFADAALTYRKVICYDLDRTSGEKLARFVAEQQLSYDVRCTSSLAEALECDVVVFATTASSPYVPTETKLRSDQLLLNISLRDLAPELLLGANNVLDDIEHCLRENTSPHLAERLSGGRDFISGTLAGVLCADVHLEPTRPIIFSPFGLAVLDVAVGDLVLRRALEAGTALAVPGFFGDTAGW